MLRVFSAARGSAGPGSMASGGDGARADMVLLPPSDTTAGSPADHMRSKTPRQEGDVNARAMHAYVSANQTSRSRVRDSHTLARRRDGATASRHGADRP